MKDYTVYVRSTTVHRVEASAETQEEALDKVRGGDWDHFGDAFFERVSVYKTQKEAFKPTKKDVAKAG